MLSAIKVWALGSRFTSSPSKRGGCDKNASLYKSSTPRLDAQQSSVDKRMDAPEVSNYGHLLHCPLCQELYTHPVLLPCQHSLCYGCARAQLLSADTAEDFAEMSMYRKSRKPSESEATSIVGSPPNSPTLKVRTNTADSSFFYMSDITSSSDGRKDESASSFVISTNDLLHFEPYKPSNKRTPKTEALSPSSGFSSSTTPSSRGSNLRRSLSASSVQRPTPTPKSRSQKYSSLKKSRVKSLYCPNCENMIELGKLGISGLFRNFALESIVEKFRSAAKAVVAVRCGYCKPPASDATKSCLDCKLSYCNECFKVVHVWGTKKARHGYIGPTNNFTRPKVLLCPEHSNEVSLYCNKCKKSVCRLCKLRGGAHVSHSVSSAKSAYREGKERLCADLAVLKSKKDEIDAKVDYLGEAFTELEKRDSETREKIHSSLDGMHRILEAKRDELLAKADAATKEQEHKLRQEMQRHHEVLMATSISSFAEEILKETDPHFFLQTSRMVELKLKEAIKSIATIKNNASLKADNALDLDLSGVQSMLENLDFIQMRGEDTDSINTTFSVDPKCERADLHWETLGECQHVELERNGKIARINNDSVIPSVIKGSVSYSSGKHYWEAAVVSYGAKQMIIGVCNVNSQEELHGSIESMRGGVLISIAPDSAQLLDEEIRNFGTFCNTSQEEMKYKNTASHSMGKHCFIIGIELQLFGENAIVQFFDVKESSEEKKLKIFRKQIKSYLPLCPLIVVKGKAIISLKK